MLLAKERLSAGRPSCEGFAGRYENKTGGEFCGSRYNLSLIHI